MAWFWYFFIYSFLGFLLEVVYVRIRGEAKRDRKCRLILPVCPVYGLGALAILLLPEVVRQQPAAPLPRRRSVLHRGGVFHRVVL